MFRHTSRLLESKPDRPDPLDGRPPASWLLVAVVTAAFIAGGLAIITDAWWLLWGCIGIVVLAVPAGR